MEGAQETLADALPRYDVEEVIGRGGWAVVVAGRHRDLDRPVAIKRLPADLAADDVARDRFRSEARVVAALDHPHIVPVYDFVEHGDVLALVMELLTGGTVWDRHHQEPFTAPQVVAIALVTASALHEAHQAGVLHRDVKPENLLCRDEATVKLSDFGVAKIVGGAGHNRTTDGMVIGTPTYLAPEQVTGGALSPATDIYAAGVMTYRLLADSFPFPDVDEPVARLFQHVEVPPIPLEDRSAAGAAVPAPVAAVVLQALAKDPSDRFLTAEAFGLALARAATRAWGAGWLRRSGIQLRSSPALVAATETERTPAPALDTHDSAEIRLLEHLEGGATLGARPDEVTAMARLLGSEGTLAAARLGLSDGASSAELRAAALAELERWRRRAEHPLSSPALREAAAVLARSCEALLARLG